MRPGARVKRHGVAIERPAECPPAGRFDSGILVIQSVGAGGHARAGTSALCQAAGLHVGQGSPRLASVTVWTLTHINS